MGMFVMQYSRSNVIPWRRSSSALKRASVSAWGGGRRAPTGLWTSVSGSPLSGRP